MIFTCGRSAQASSSRTSAAYGTDFLCGVIVNSSRAIHTVHPFAENRKSSMSSDELASPKRSRVAEQKEHAIAQRRDVVRHREEQYRKAAIVSASFFTTAVQRARA